MTRSGAHRATLAQSLQRLRLRLTAWYAGTFFVILALLGIGIFASTTRRFDSELDASLQDATRELLRVARARDSISHGSTSVLFDPAADLRIPDRALYLVDSAGISDRSPIDPWLQALAQRAWRERSAGDVHRAEPERLLRAHAQASVLRSGRSLIAIAVADEIELEDRYASLIAAFGLSALVAVVLVAVGGWIVAGKAVAPVEEAVAHMRRFIADAAHELRTPLTVVRARAEVALQRPREPDDYVTTLRGIERETTRFGRLVEDLLMLARADAGERTIVRQHVYLDDVVLDAAEAARVIADRKSVRLEVADFEESAVHGDPALLRQLVMILLDNAIKFTAPGAVVRVQVISREKAASLAVTDEGIGIRDDQLPHVFERFYRGDPSRTRGAATDGFDGAGLGLSIASWIVNEHDAKITIDSQPGQGTRVVVVFPRLVTDAVSSS
jgi:signal transduction histidine kinase